MPVYLYKCSKCKHQEERLLPIDTPAEILVKCPKCKKETSFRKVIIPFTSYTGEDELIRRARGTTKDFKNWEGTWEAQQTKIPLIKRGRVLKMY